MTSFMIATAIQGIVIFIDEFYFHHKRGLPLWERLGHPIDSFSVLACLAFLMTMPHTPNNELIYSFLAAVSCVVVTKDEFIHWKICTGLEMWLHALLFVLHPIVLFSAIKDWETNPLMIQITFGMIFSFFIYQIIYWNFLRSEEEQNLGRQFQN
jgi:hypothetical protein